MSPQQFLGLTPERRLFFWEIVHGKRGPSAWKFVLSALRRARRPFNILMANRDSALDSERRFWDKWFLTRGLAWPAEYRERLNPQQPLSSFYCQFVDQLPASRVRILDVGAGPLTILGKTHRSKQLEIVA